MTATSASATPPAIVVILTTLGAGADAESLARTLVSEGLAACVNILPLMTSVYRWRGLVEQQRERQLVIKTAAAQVEALRQRLRTLHPYELPEFVVLPAGASDAYAAWVGESLTPSAPSGS